MFHTTHSVIYNNKHTYWLKSLGLVGHDNSESAVHYYVMKMSELQ